MDRLGPLANRAEPALGVSGLYTRPYPGFLAPASLKRDQRFQGWRFQGSYPGFLAPASLKRPSASLPGTSALRLSGVSCPGLIEAPAT